jgi:glyceraldehyde-3-phosphate dehydrogenase/erythrose-4-phosphate dehydrogenase
MSIVPTPRGRPRPSPRSIPSLKGNWTAWRCGSTPNVSLVDLTVEVEKGGEGNYAKREINAALKAASQREN